MKSSPWVLPLDQPIPGPDGVTLAEAQFQGNARFGFVRSTFGPLGEAKGNRAIQGSPPGPPSLAEPRPWTNARRGR